MPGPERPAPRLFVDGPIAPGAEFILGANASRHVQVLRLQPGAALTLFDGLGGQWTALVVRIGRRDVVVRAGVHQQVERELARRVTLALGSPANERMDGLIEKAAELGVATIQPLVCERSVQRVAGERAERKATHWRAVAVAACEQCGRNRVPEIAPPMGFFDWLGRSGATNDERWLLSLDESARWPPVRPIGRSITVLSGPEGGLSEGEQAAARSAGYQPHSLGARVLRADTAPLAVLAWIALEPV